MSAAGAMQNGPAVLTAPRQRWIVAEPHLQQAEELASAARIPVVLAELLIARGITASAEAFAFLNPEVAHLHDPLQMLGMQPAVERIEAGIARKEPILLYGDYDVDGTTAVVLLKTAIEMLGGAVRFHVPHRIREGYGLQSAVLESAYTEGVRLVVTVDTGMRAFAEAGAAEVEAEHRETEVREGLGCVVHSLGVHGASAGWVRMGDDGGVESVG